MHTASSHCPSGRGTGLRVAARPDPGSDSPPAEASMARRPTRIMPGYTSWHPCELGRRSSAGSLSRLLRPMEPWCSCGQSVGMGVRTAQRTSLRSGTNPSRSGNGEAADVVRARPGRPAPSSQEHPGFRGWRRYRWSRPAPRAVPAIGRRDTGRLLNAGYARRSPDPDARG